MGNLEENYMAKYSAQDSKHKNELTKLYNFKAVGFSVQEECTGEEKSPGNEVIDFPVSYTDAIVGHQAAWFTNNQPVIKAISDIDFNEETRKFKDFFEIGNKKINAITRVYYFLNTIQHPPDNPVLFRFNLGPKSAFEMSNNYSITLALAYEFMYTVAQHTEEYCHFLKSLRLFLPKRLTTDIKQHLVYWPYWAVYNYPILLSTFQTYQPIFVKPDAIYDNFIPPSQSSIPEFKCQTLGCNQVFKYKFLLYEHNSTMGCGLTAEEKALLSSPKDLIKCPFYPCPDSSKNLLEFRTHFSVNHIQSSEIKKEFDSGHYECPFCQVVHVSEDQLRCHIGETHLN